ncbi:MAG: SCO family protein [Planctomycetota bacterium]|nr:MAG: SCO family protein [Planctomycetota bacterium]REJ96243.1 MAG: SCO family protein [Planctomycetota bacterium]
MSGGVKVWLAVLVLGAGAYVAYRFLPRDADGELPNAKIEATTDADDASDGKVVVPGEAPVDLASFTMTERSGESYNFEQLRGEVWVANTFFSSCPHQCRAMNTSVQALHKHPDFQEVRFVSISVDPVEDTPEELASYADTFSADRERWLFMNGKLRDVRRFGKEMGVVAGLKEHTRELVVFDHTGTFRGAYTYNSEPEIEELRKLLRELLAAKRGDAI